MASKGEVFIVGLCEVRLDLNGETYKDIVKVDTKKRLREKTGLLSNA